MLESSFTASIDEGVSIIPKTLSIPAYAFPMSGPDAATPPALEIANMRTKSEV